MDRCVNGLFRRGLSMAQLRSQPDYFSSSKVRQSFIDFFSKDKDHFHIRSSPVFSQLDPTLAFVNAGMNQFKDVFLGLNEPCASKMVNYQKCIRVGGKHNDLSQVGQDGSHHSFFEMLGNWSFGDYFKREACVMSWELLTKVYNLSPERLYVTYFGGDTALNLEADEEVREIWREIGIEDHRIIPFGSKENFWEMGLTGPCGVCTEIHYDHVPGRKNAGNLVNVENSGITELWNLVFIQYNRTGDGNITELKKNFVDTGMGFERLVAVLQGKNSNYDTDVFLPLFEAIKRHSGHTGYTGQYEGHYIDSAYRILADHSRMFSIALSDNMLPNDRYKLRSIIRRALTVAKEAFNCNSSLLKEVASVVTDVLADAYPELETNLSKIHYIIESEEKILLEQQQSILKQWKNIKNNYPFIKESDILDTPSLIAGLNHMKKRKEMGEKTVSDEDAFFLWDSHGLPPEKTGKLALMLGMDFNTSSFEKYELKYKQTEKQIQTQKVHEKFYQSLNPKAVEKLLDMKLEPTKDYFKYKYRVNVGGKYIFPKQLSTIQAIVCDDLILDEITPENSKNRDIGLVLDRTQLFSGEFNRESDSGTFLIENKILFNIHKVIKIKDLVIHFGEFKNFPSDAKVAINNSGIIEMDENKRMKLMRNHSALILLKGFIRQKFPFTAEKSSIVLSDKFSLDLMLYRDKLHLKDFIDLEKLVNDAIRNDVSICRRPLTHSEFYSLTDVACMPGISLLASEIPVIEIDTRRSLIREVCSGTHTLSTSHILSFVIKKSSKTNYGYVIRIEGVTGDEANITRQAETLIKEDWNRLKKEIVDLNKLESAKVYELEGRLKETIKNLKLEQLSYNVKNEIANEEETLKKKLKLLLKQCIRISVEKEITQCLKSTNEIFAVHYFETSPKNVSVVTDAAVNFCPDKPFLFFIKEKEKVKAYCSVPEKFKCDKFNTENWLANATSSFNFENKANNKNSVLNLSICNNKLTEEEIKKIVDKGYEFARKNLAM